MVKAIRHSQTDNSDFLCLVPVACCLKFNRQDMMSRARLIFIIFYLTAVLISIIHLRTASSRMFFKSRASLVTQNRLKQQLWQKQLQFESLINPGAISENQEGQSEK